MQVYSCQRHFPYCYCLPCNQSNDKLEDVTHKLQEIAKRAAELQYIEHMSSVCRQALNCITLLLHVCFESKGLRDCIGTD